MVTVSEGFSRRICTGCGTPALVSTGESSSDYRCDSCGVAVLQVGEEPGELTVHRLWTESRGSAAGATGMAFSALDEVFNPGAVRAREQLKADHERQVPVPSPGEDALRTGSLVIRMPKSAGEPAPD
jgi:hypothetical protein